MILCRKLRLLSASKGTLEYFLESDHIEIRFIGLILVLIEGHCELVKLGLDLINLGK
jgi:hypothetical protein